MQIINISVLSLQIYVFTNCFEDAHVITGDKYKRRGMVTLSICTESDIFFALLNISRTIRRESRVVDVLAVRKSYKIWKPASIGRAGTKQNGPNDIEK